MPSEGSSHTAEPAAPGPHHPQPLTQSWRPLDHKLQEWNWAVWSLESDLHVIPAIELISRCCWKRSLAPPPRSMIYGTRS